MIGGRFVAAAALSFGRFGAFVGASERSIIREGIFAAIRTAGVWFSGATDRRRGRRDDDGGGVGGRREGAHDSVAAANAPPVVAWNHEWCVCDGVRVRVRKRDTKVK